MIKGLGIDIVETARIRQVIERHGEQFLNRVYTPAEQAVGKIRASAQHFYAGRWAAKEAAAKALGCGIGSVSLRWFSAAALPEQPPLSVQKTSGFPLRTKENMPLLWSSSKSKSEKNYLSGKDT